MIKTLLFSLLSFMLSIAQADVNSHFSAIKSDPNALYAFFKAMPKGGELHYHLAGGAYPETMLDLAIQHNYCIDPNTQIISAPPCEGTAVPAATIKSALYHQVIRAWSMKDFIPGIESGHDHFFASFFKFLPVESAFRPQLLAEIMKRAANQQELYLEIMVLPDNANSTSFAPLISSSPDYAAKQRQLLANQKFQDNISHTVTESTYILKQARHLLGCDSATKSAACSVTVKFQYYVLREQPLDKIFAQALNVFAAAAQSQDTVGVNLVQSEGDRIATHDYREQMRIFKFLHAAYPNVHIALHAGELAPEAVPPATLRFHIHDAIFTGHASRIGHGVSVAYEDDEEKLLNYMAKTPIPVEINLTSNRKILGIAGKNHPLNYYLAHQVPVVLSTDDEGVIRTDLTREYVAAVLHHGLDYPTIKTINRNALTYSFLPGKSIWTNPSKHIAVPECQVLTSPSCQRFINASEKARLQWQLEKKLMAFEGQY